MTTPLVGVTTWRRKFETYIGDDPLHSLSDYYVAAVVDSGMIPILFAAGQSTRDAARLVSMVDGLVLSGGGDVDPAMYGATRDLATDGDDPAVDEFEVALVQEARTQGTPVLAICRGLQLLNVALGGTLNQEVSSAGGVHAPIKGDPAALNARQHVVHFETGSLLAEVYGSEELSVNTLHHQGVQRLADDLVVEGRTTDGQIEAARCSGGWWAVGVQWHPERLDANHHKPMFSAFRHAIENN